MIQLTEDTFGSLRLLNQVIDDWAAAGMCHSDVHTVRGDWGPQKYPLIPGHEIIGALSPVPLPSLCLASLYLLGCRLACWRASRSALGCTWSRFWRLVHRLGGMSLSAEL